ncbi:hypothetical protein [Streptomyces griseorubiginosus]|uniref:hypothetical protein n=1 Tax=Streptomyces griseorubiginosus TaxID=67304 RepID=UPI001AD6B2B7|nr:hypothetical protein [Streptomyces griseorubiginosus]MBO4252645.1 hypothetical protein [Streptomyces griseorubiginosus]
MSPYPRRQVLGAAVAVTAAGALPLAAASDTLAAGPGGGKGAAGWVPVPDPVPVPLDSLYDNDGIDTATARGGGFDGSGYTFPGEELPAGRVEVDGVPFDFPSSTAGTKNNVVALGQRVDLPRGRYLSAVFLTTRLRETGAWLKVNGEAVYDTTYWSRMAQLGEDLRFTVRPNEAFYIHSLTRPGAKLTVEAPVPIRPGDKVTPLGHDRPLTWTVGKGALVIDVPETARKAGQHVWVFKVEWHG